MSGRVEFVVVRRDSLDINAMLTDKSIGASVVLEKDVARKHRVITRQKKQLMYGKLHGSFGRGRGKLWI